MLLKIAKANISVEVGETNMQSLQKGKKVKKKNKKKEQKKRTNKVQMYMNN